MSRPVLVDSSWYIGQARNGIDPLRVLSFLAETRDIGTCGVIMAEVGRGLKHPTHLRRYQAAWDLMFLVDSAAARWRETLQIAWQLDRRGVILPLQDLHIAACALHAGAVILTLDKHFQQIPGVDATDRIF